MLPDLLQHLESIRVRQAYIEQDEVGLFLTCQYQPRFPSIRLQDIIAFVRKKERQGLKRSTLVFNDQNEALQGITSLGK